MGKKANPCLSPSVDAGDITPDIAARPDDAPPKEIPAEYEPAPPFAAVLKSIPPRDCPELDIEYAAPSTTNLPVFGPVVPIPTLPS